MLAATIKRINNSVQHIRFKIEKHKLIMLTTPLKHFNEDIERAKALKNFANGLANNELKRDIFRASWMTAVGAFDAYYCDAYGDLLSRTFRAKKAQSGVSLPNKLNSITVPIPVVLANDLSGGWAWRMIARDLIEKDNVLSINKVKNLFNVFFRNGHKLFTDDGAPLIRWINKQQNAHRLFGFLRSQYRAAGVGTPKAAMRKAALEKLKERLGMILQRRHDCIHNCDRPKSAITRKHMTYRYVTSVILDLEYVVNCCHEDFLTEFPVFLTDLGFSSVTRNSVGA